MAITWQVTDAGQPCRDNSVASGHLRHSKYVESHKVYRWRPRFGFGMKGADSLMMECDKYLCLLIRSWNISQISQGPARGRKPEKKHDGKSSSGLHRAPR